MYSLKEKIRKYFAQIFEFIFRPIIIGLHAKFLAQGFQWLSIEAVLILHENKMAEGIKLLAR